ncbi:hypothetical protein D9756_004254 [Leucocoprinus leucothites]|uniref:Uncharacterized protein n=1 Tax=Leucocoprinus leucothites TaxID=201217 RepID=A0A8H5LDQ7_9AGAR|nr:hypothetical protein D9756_004254 [Leucoagaricus leucothites]
MLKRQRAPSPMPQSPSIPHDMTPFDGIIDIRDLKRRRVVPPSLDGQTRGWNTHPSNPNSAEEEEYDEEDYCEEHDPHGRGEAGFPQSEGREGNAEYTEVNSVLKEMHILHKHRQTFIPPVPSLPHVPQNHPPHSELDKNRLSSHTGYQMVAEESARVYEHYEGTNRSLASAFLSRRQHSAGQPSHS